MILVVDAEGRKASIEGVGVLATQETGWGIRPDLKLGPGLATPRGHIIYN